MGIEINIGNHSSGAGDLSIPPLLNIYSGNESKFIIHDPLGNEVKSGTFAPADQEPAFINSITLPNGFFLILPS